jgi:UDP-3-O-[3-hydroxymyristoyl] glucosamine N-acyltransferase
VRLRELGERLGREVRGDGEVTLRGVAPLESAVPGELSFVRSLAWARRIAETRASALIVPAGVETGEIPALISPDPGLDFARAVALILPQVRPPAGIHPSAFVAPGAEVHTSATIGPLCSIGARSRVGVGSVLHAGVHLYPDVLVGADCVLHAGCVVREGTELGDRVILQPGVILGGDGFGYAFDETGGFEKVPQVGRVVLEDDVEIGAHTTVDRATLGETRIRRGAKIDNLVMIGHNCDVGEGAAIVGQAGLAGSTTVGRGAMLMAQSGSGGHLTIGERAFVAARAGLHKDVAPGARVYGAPAMEERRWHRMVSAMTRLPEALRRLRAVEKRLGIGLPAAEKPDESA